MEQKQAKLKAHVIEASSNLSFVHHQWFVTWHLEIAEKIAEELLSAYPQANADMVRAMVWLHDYGKILDFDGQYEQKYVDAGRDKMIEIGFESGFAQAVADNIALADTKTDLDKAPIEVQILSSADGCSHLVGPFVRLYWWENPQKPYEDIMTENIRKLTVDWQKKVVLPEAKKAFQQRHELAVEQSGQIPDSFIS